MTPRLYALLGTGALILALVVGLIVQSARLSTRTAQLTTCEAQKAQLAADVRAKTAEAQAADIAHKAAVEAQQDTVSKETADALEQQLADARASADRYAQRLRAAPATGARGGGTAGVSQPSGAAGSVDAAPDAAVVADAQSCATAYVVAKGWQDWFTAQARIAR